MQSPEAAPKRVVDETIRLYQNLLGWSAPDHQLARPSFNTIHESVRRVVGETRILRDVFLPGDLVPLSNKTTTTTTTTKAPPNGKQSSKNWDRREKGIFVQKLLEFVAQNGQALAPCSASKLAAGLEPLKANELLQALARVAEGSMAQRKSANNQLTVGPGSSRKSSVSSANSIDQKKSTKTGKEVGQTKTTASQLTVNCRAQARPSTYTRRGSGGARGPEESSGERKQRASKRQADGATNDAEQLTAGSRSDSMDSQQQQQSNSNKRASVISTTNPISRRESKAGQQASNKRVIPQDYSTNNVNPKGSSNQANNQDILKYEDGGDDDNDNHNAKIYAILQENFTKLKDQLINLEQTSIAFEKRIERIAPPKNE